MNQDEGRRKARENGAAALHRHEQMKGRDVSFESCQRKMNERADRIDAKRDRNIKE